MCIYIYQIVMQMSFQTPLRYNYDEEKLTCMVNETVVYTVISCETIGLLLQSCDNMLFISLYNS